MEFDRHEQAMTVCVDAACRWAGLPDGEHFDRHNPPCAQMFITTRSTTVVCGLLDGHDGPHRGDELPRS